MAQANDIPHRASRVPDGLEPIPREPTFPQAIPAPWEDTDAKEIAPPRDSAWKGHGSEKKIFGLRRTTFILLALLILVIIVAAVGGGVGGSVAVNRAYDRGLADAATPVIGSDTDTDGDSASATDGESKPTKTSDRIQAPPTSGLLELDCPNLTGSTHRIDLGDNTYSFKANCGVNHAEGDLTTVVAYSYEDCMIACAAFNHIANIKDTKCVAVHFNAQMRTSKGGNCWLKKKLNDLSVSTSSQANDQMELELLD